MGRIRTRCVSCIMGRVQMGLVLTFGVFLLSVRLCGSSHVQASPMLQDPGTRVGGQVRITSIEMAPYFTQQQSPSGEYFSGYLVDLIDQISRSVPYRFAWTIVASRNENKSKRISQILTTKLISEEVDVIVVPKLYSYGSVAHDSHLANTRGHDSHLANTRVHDIHVDNQRAHDSHLVNTRACLRSTLSLLIRAVDLPDVALMPFLTDTNLNDAISPRYYDFGVVRNSRVEEFLRKSNDSALRRIWKKISDGGKRFATLEEGLTNVENGGRQILILESTEANHVASERPCEFQAVDQYIDFANYTFFTKNLDLAQHLNTALERLEEADVLNTLQKKWWNATDCSDLVTDYQDGRSNLPMPEMDRNFITSPYQGIWSRTNGSSTAPPFNSSSSAPSEPAPVSAFSSTSDYDTTLSSESGQRSTTVGLVSGEHGGNLNVETGKTHSVSTPRVDSDGEVRSSIGYISSNSTVIPGNYTTPIKSKSNRHRKGPKHRSSKLTNTVVTSTSTLRSNPLSNPGGKHTEIPPELPPGLSESSSIQENTSAAYESVINSSTASQNGSSQPIFDKFDWIFVTRIPRNNDQSDLEYETNDVVLSSDLNSASLISHAHIAAILIIFWIIKEL